MQLKGFYIMGFGCWFAMIPHDFQGILDNIDRKTSCSDLATSFVWHLFLENAWTRMLFLATLWIFILCLRLYQPDIFFVSWGEFVQLKLCGKEGHVANHPVFGFAMLQLHASEGSWYVSCRKKRHPLQLRLGSAVASTWTSPTIACIPWALMRPCSAWISEGASWTFWYPGAWQIVGWPHNNKSSVNFLRLYGMAHGDACFWVLCKGKAVGELSGGNGSLWGFEKMTMWSSLSLNLMIKINHWMMDDGWWIMGDG